MSNKKKCPAEEARIRLLNKIRGYSLNDVNINMLIPNEDNCILLNEISDEEIIIPIKQDVKISKINLFLNRIKSKGISKSLIEGDRISPYYLPEYTKNILRLCKEFPLWTNIMCAVFKSPYKSATSA